MEFSKTILVFLIYSLLFSTKSHHFVSGHSPPNSPSHKNYRPHQIVCKNSHFASSHFKQPTFANHVLGEICSKTKDPRKCITLISPCITGSVNPFSALEAVIFASFEHVKYAHSLAFKLSKNKYTSSELKTALNLCMKLYIKILGDLNKALAAFNNHDISTVKFILTGAITDFGHCDQAFHQQGFTTNWPLKGIDHTLTQLAGFGVDVILHARI